MTEDRRHDRPHDRLFISYAHRDGAHLAARLQQDLTTNGFDAWLDTRGIQGGAVWTLIIEEEIDNRDVILALLTPASYRSEICRAEQLRALRKGKRLIPILAAKDADLPLHIEPFQYRNFSESGSYSASFRELLEDIRGEVSATLREAFCQTRLSYITAPPLVANYIERPEAVRSLRDSLFAEDQRRPIALTALAGMGGIGKTVLAQALIRDEVVQQAFPDGIVWLTVGREKQQDFVQQMREIAKALGDDLSRYDNPVACQNQYKTILANKAALIVVDDIWLEADIDALLAESPRSRFLFTTRDASIANFTGAREHRADLLDVAQSRELLAGWAGLPIAQLPPEADEIIRECGRLPLALSQIGAVLRGGAAGLWRDTLDLLLRVDLSAIQEQLPPGQDNFFRAVGVSFLALAAKMQEKYKALAVLLEDMAAPLPILQTLWNASEAEARRISKHFVDKSLAQRDANREGIQLHDLQLYYVRFQYPDEEALELIHGAMRLSSHVIAKEPLQFAGQMSGRLMTHRRQTEVQQFVANIVAGAPRPWLRTCWPTLDQAGGSLLRTLEGHSSGVYGVAVTPDGKRAVSASDDKTLRVWDLKGGQPPLTLEAHSSAVRRVAVVPGGKRAVSASNDNTLKVWDLENAKPLRTLRGHSNWVSDVAVTPDGKWAVSAAWDNTLKVWDLESDQSLHTLHGHSAKVNGVAVTPDGKRAISASDDKTLIVWDLESSKPLRALRGHSAKVNGVAVTPDGRHVVSASEDKTLRMWDLESHEHLFILQGHSDAVNGVTVAMHGKRAVSASDDNTLRVWDLESGKPLRTLHGHSSKVNGVAVTPDGSRAVSASEDNTLKLWDLTDDQPLQTVGGHSHSVTDVAVIPDRGRFVSASWDNTIKVWDLESGQPLVTLEGHLNRVNAVAITSNGCRAISGSYDKTLRVWNLESGKPVRTLHGHSDVVNGVAVTRENRCAISTSRDNTVRLWDMENGELLGTLTGHSDWVYGIAVTSDGRRAISASWDKTLRVWDLESGQPLRILEGHLDRVNDVAITADEGWAVSASDDNTLMIWDLNNGRRLRTLKGHSDQVNAVAIMPNGKRAASVSYDNTLKLWDLKSGEAILTFTLESAGYCCKCVSAGTILAGDAGGHIYLLSLEE